MRTVASPVSRPLQSEGRIASHPVRAPARPPPAVRSQSIESFVTSPAAEGDGIPERDSSWRGFVGRAPGPLKRMRTPATAARRPSGWRPRWRREHLSGRCGALLPTEQAPHPNNPSRFSTAGGSPSRTARPRSPSESSTAWTRSRSSRAVVSQITGRANGLAPVASVKRGRWTVRLAQSTPGSSVVRVKVGEHLFEDSAGAEAEAQLPHPWLQGLARQRRVGLRHRRAHGRHAARARADRRRRDAGHRREAGRSSVSASRCAPTSTGSRSSAVTGSSRWCNPDGDVVARGPDALSFAVAGKVTVERVEHSMGYPDHGFEDRDYVNRFFAAVTPGASSRRSTWSRSRR